MEGKRGADTKSRNGPSGPFGCFALLVSDPFFPTHVRIRLLPWFPEVWRIRLPRAYPRVPERLPDSERKARPGRFELQAGIGKLRRGGCIVWDDARPMQCKGSSHPDFAADADITRMFAEDLLTDW